MTWRSRRVLLPTSRGLPARRPQKDPGAIASTWGYLWLCDASVGLLPPSRDGVAAPETHRGLVRDESYIPEMPWRQEQPGYHESRAEGREGQVEGALLSRPPYLRLSRQGAPEGGPPGSSVLTHILNNAQELHPIPRTTNPRNRIVTSLPHNGFTLCITLSVSQEAYGSDQR